MAQIYLECTQINQDNGLCDIYEGTLLNTSSTPLYVETQIEIVQATTTQQIYEGFTYGEIIISLWLFLIFMVGIFSLFWFGIIKPHIHRIHLK